MADAFIGLLTAVPDPLDGTEPVPIEQDDETYKTTTQDIADLATADGTSFDPTSGAGGLVSVTVQNAIEELLGRLAASAFLNIEDQTLTGGVIVTSKSLGTITTGTVTPDPGDRPQQHYTNGGAHTLAPSANVGSVLLDITNNGSAGAITTPSFNIVTGDAFTTTNGHKFRCHVSIGDAGSLLSVQAMQ